MGGETPWLSLMPPAPSPHSPSPRSTLSFALMRCGRKGRSLAAKHSCVQVLALPLTLSWPWTSYFSLSLICLICQMDSCEDSLISSFSHSTNREHWVRSLLSSSEGKRPTFEECTGVNQRKSVSSRGNRTYKSLHKEEWPV